MCSSSTTTELSSRVRSSSMRRVMTSLNFSGVHTSSPPPPSGGGSLPPPPPKKRRTWILDSGPSMRSSSSARSRHRLTNGRTMIPIEPGTECRRRISKVSETSDFPPLVGAQYTKLDLWSNTPSRPRHARCHGYRRSTRLILRKYSTVASGNPTLAIESSSGFAGGGGATVPGRTTLPRWWFPCERLG